MAKRKNQAAFSRMYLANALQGKVQGWVDQGWPGVTRTTLELFHYWFKRDERTGERFYNCQRRAIETIVYCHEILQTKSLKGLFERVAPEVIPEHLPLKQEIEGIAFPKYALKMATGSGKTWVLAALLIWHYFNRLNNERAGNYSYRFLIITPGHEVLNRLLDSFKGKRDPKTNKRIPESSDYKRPLFIPEGANWRDRFQLEILEPTDLKPNTTPPDCPFVFITNWQQFRLKTGAKNLWAHYTGEDVEEMPRGEVILDFLSRYPDLIIMNDEAHHVHNKKGAKGEELVWRQFMNRLYEWFRESHKDNIDDYTSEYCFGQPIDFTKQENYVVLNYTLVYDHIVQTIRQAIVKLIQGYKYEVKGIWGRLADLPRIMVRESKSIETDKSIYPRIGYQTRGGGFERDFMLEVLNPSSEVISYAKLERWHKLEISYRDETGIMRKYEVDFLLKTTRKNYLVETKADRDINTPNIAVKLKAAIAWCEQASTVLPPQEFQQPQEWEYLILSEALFKNNRGLGFEAFIPLCRGLRDKILAQAEGKLYF